MSMTGVMAEVIVLCRNLARFERIKKIVLIPDVFSNDNRELTAMMKVKRYVVSEKYADENEAMYA